MVFWGVTPRRTCGGGSRPWPPASRSTPRSPGGNRDSSPRRPPTRGPPGAPAPRPGGSDRPQILGSPPPHLLGTTPPFLGGLHPRFLGTFHRFWGHRITLTWGHLGGGELGDPPFLNPMGVSMWGWGRSWRGVTPPPKIMGVAPKKWVTPNTGCPLQFGAPEVLGDPPKFWDPSNPGLFGGGLVPVGPPLFSPPPHFLPPPLGSPPSPPISHAQAIEPGGGQSHGGGHPQSRGVGVSEFVFVKILTKIQENHPKIFTASPPHKHPPLWGPPPGPPPPRAVTV